MEDLYGKPYDKLPHNFDEYKMSAIRQDIKQGKLAMRANDKKELSLKQYIDKHYKLPEK